MQRNKPPFRADMVGSLLRTQTLKDAREKHAAGRDRRGALKAVEDREIRALISKQEEIGLQAVTDGEFRRAFWHFDFLEHLDGVQRRRGRPRACTSRAASASPKALRVHRQDRLLRPPDARALPVPEGRTRSRVPKMTIPGPSMLHYRGGRKMIECGLYPDMDAFYADLGAAYAKAVRAFYDAGCRYLQLDDISLRLSLRSRAARDAARARRRSRQAAGHLCRHGAARR